ncbi:DUF6364 family protein [Sphingobacterium hungaricum]|uniref:Toxin-antitoxin system, antitoxin component, ribbon-helix-helix domain protein n=1 Tax=Sphingobacterium hungaricum TaxID=2082723 RepID=A0A928UT80_9SPHI|nr:DUF6364 family protein [Sphingobacterium hungaricum]MBE8712403.1 hypothetical protein [Sphingobacterium hungaricum]
MGTKLILEIDNDIIVRAKKYASKKNVSLSLIIENYLDSLTYLKDKDLEVSPFVKSITNGESIPEDYDVKKERKDFTSYLEKKHQ